MSNADADNFLFAYVLKVTDEATELARLQGVIGSNQKIFCRLDVVPADRDTRKFYQMTVREYFTKERFLAAGQDPSRTLGRILNACYGSTDGRHPRIHTVQELIDYTAKEFMKRKNIDEKSLSAIREVFACDGIVGF